MIDSDVGSEERQSSGQGGGLSIGPIKLALLDIGRGCHQGSCNAFQAKMKAAKEAKARCKGRTAQNRYRAGEASSQRRGTPLYNLQCHKACVHVLYFLGGGLSTVAASTYS